MIAKNKFKKIFLIITFTLLNYSALAEEEEVYLKAISDQIQVITKDLKTLEKAVYQKSDVVSSKTLNTIKSDGLNEQIAAELGYDVVQGVKVIRRLETITSRKHGTGYPANRESRLREVARGAPVSAEFVEIRQRRYQNEIKK